MVPPDILAVLIICSSPGTEICYPDAVSVLKPLVLHLKTLNLLASHQKKGRTTTGLFHFQMKLLPPQLFAFPATETAYIFGSNWR